MKMTYFKRYDGVGYHKIRVKEKNPFYKYYKESKFGRDPKYIEGKTIEV